MTTDTKVADPLPCPFCGYAMNGEDDGPYQRAGFLGAQTPVFSVTCNGDGCNAEVTATSKEASVAGWNRRAALARQEADHFAAERLSELLARWERNAAIPPSPNPAAQARRELWAELLAELKSILPLPAAPPSAPVGQEPVAEMVSEDSEFLSIRFAPEFLARWAAGKSLLGTKLYADPPAAQAQVEGLRAANECKAIDIRERDEAIHSLAKRARNAEAERDALKAQAVDLEQFRKLADRALANLSNALDNLEYSPDQRPVPLIKLAMDDLRDIDQQAGKAGGA